jgi:sarcosine oxidase
VLITSTLQLDRRRLQAENSTSIQTVSGERNHADRFVFACGPWLPKISRPAWELIHVTRQEVVFFGVPAGDESFNQDVLPVWIDFNDLVYGLPNLDGRGFKLAIDAHGPEFDPDTGERVVTAAGLNAVRDYSCPAAATARKCAGN